jgi:hypothetical protein
MGDMNKHCPMCGARPGERCKVISGDPEAGERPGDWRSEPHFYRHNDRPIPVLIPDEPPFASGPDGTDESERNEHG